MKKRKGPLPWLKLWHEYLDKAKVQILSESLRARHINLLCIACKEDDDGRLPSVTLIAHMLHLSESETLSTLNDLIKAKLVNARTADDVTIYRIHDWEDWQDRKSPAAIRQQKTRDKRNAERDALRNEHATNAVISSVTNCATRALAPPSGSVSVSDSLEGGAGGNVVPMPQNDPSAVRGLADATEARWSGQFADVFVGDLCKTFDWRLVAKAIDQAYDKDPRNLPRSYVRTTCQNMFNRGWKPEAVTSPNGQTSSGKPSTQTPEQVAEFRKAEAEKKARADQIRASKARQANA